MIIYHSKLELKKWCINRDYLMYQEGLINKAEFLKNVEEDTEDVKKMPTWKRKWRNRNDYEHVRHQNESP